MSVEADYREITERLKPEREKLQGALESIDTELRGPHSKMWRIQLREIRPGAEGRTRTLDVPRYNVFLYGPEGWTPQVGGDVPVQHVGDMLIWKIVSYTEVDHPMALEAQQEFGNVLPQIEGYTTDQDVDIDELILLPEKLGEFHSGWKSAADTMTSVPNAIRDIGRLQGDRWTGEGAEQHLYVVEDMQGAAQAAIDGIKNAMSNVLYIGETGVAIASALLDVATETANQAADWVDMIVGFSPANWRSTIGRIAKKAAELNEIHNERVKAGLQEVLRSAEWNNAVDQQFIDLKTALGGEIVWPRADPALRQRWGRS